jgi:hypothetical protein
MVERENRESMKMLFRFGLKTTQTRAIIRLWIQKHHMTYLLFFT